MGLIPLIPSQPGTVMGSAYPDSYPLVLTLDPMRMKELFDGMERFIHDYRFKPLEGNFLEQFCDILEQFEDFEERSLFLEFSNGYRFPVVQLREEILEEMQQVLANFGVVASNHYNEPDTPDFVYVLLPKVEA